MILQAKSYLQFIYSKQPHNAVHLHVHVESCPQSSQ